MLQIYSSSIAYTSALWNQIGRLQETEQGGQTFKNQQNHATNTLRTTPNLSSSVQPSYSFLGLV